MEEKDLEQLAREELLRDTKRAAVRAELVGAHGWAKPTKPRTNKRFLNTMMINTVHSSSLIGNKQKEGRISSNSYKKEHTNCERNQYYDHSKKRKLKAIEPQKSKDKSSKIKKTIA